MASFRKLVLAGKRKNDQSIGWSYNKGEYDVLCTIGSGGCSNVVLAKCKKNQQVCAIKQIDLSGPCAIDRSLREIRLMSKLKHPHIISMNAAFVSEDELWIVEDFFPLGSLEDVMIRGSEKIGGLWAFNERSIASMLRDVLVALDHLHKNGFVHNDIKPGNIFLKHDGNAILADLGAARSVRDITPGMVTTEAYRAPEIHRKSLISNTKSDIWSVGITALVLYGEEELTSVNFAERIRAVMDMEFQGLSYAFRQFLTCSLNIDPDDRAPISFLLRLEFLQPDLDKQTIADTAAEHFNSRPDTSRMAFQEEIVERVVGNLFFKSLNAAAESVPDISE